VSRPTNPTGNVLTDAEIEQLDVLATERDLPLIIDGAYGTPFPNIIFTDATPFWDSNIILCLSLSKLGLAGVRTGIVIAQEDIIQSITSANAILNLTPGSFGPGLTTNMVRDGSILEISNQFIQPFYQSRAEIAINWLESELAGYPFRVHTPEGAIFLWLWLNDLPITSEMLYQRLKARDVLVIPGEHFFPGLTEPWKHRHECIRVSYAQDQQTVERGIAIIAEEVRAAYDNAAL
jgi:valine--pyruvate aminotransferase